jgi:hypothetical protein
MSRRKPPTREEIIALAKKARSKSRRPWIFIFRVFTVGVILMLMEYSIGYGFSMEEHTFNDLLVEGSKGLLIGAILCIYDFIKTDHKIKKYQTQIEKLNRKIT